MTINCESCIREYDCDWEDAEDCKDYTPAEAQEEIFRLTPWGCLEAILKDYGVDVSWMTGRVGEHMVEDFMDLMCRQGHIKRAEDCEEYVEERENEEEN
jgi:hypothetical protein